MKPYTFYIKNGKAVQHPVGGGTILNIGYYGRGVDAVNVQAQGNKVIVTYEDGQVTEYPWPETGGSSRVLVSPQRGWRKGGNASCSQGGGDGGDGGSAAIGGGVCVAIGGLIIGIGLAVWALHAPMGWFAHKQLEIPLRDAIEASMHCWPGWIGSTLIWIPVIGLLFGLIELCKGKNAFGCGIGKALSYGIIVAGLATWYVWNNLEEIKHSYEANKIERSQKATREELETTTVSEQRTPKLIPTENVNIEKQSTTVTENLPPKPTQKLEDNYLVLIDKDGYVLLKAKDGRSIRMEIMNLNTSSVLLRRADGVIFDIPLKRLDANSAQRVVASWKASNNVAVEEKFYFVSGIESGDTLNVRIGAGTNYDIVARLPSSSRGLRIMGESIMNGATEWVQIAFGERTGWVAKVYLKAE